MDRKMGTFYNESLMICSRILFCPSVLPPFFLQHHQSYNRTPDLSKIIPRFIYRFFHETAKDRQPIQADGLASLIFVKDLFFLSLNGRKKSELVLPVCGHLCPIGTDLFFAFVQLIQIVASGGQRIVFRFTDSSRLD